MEEVLTLMGGHQFKVFTTKTQNQTFKATWEDIRDGETGDTGGEESDEALAMLAAKFYAHARCRQKYPEQNLNVPPADSPSPA